jgi:Ca2+-binding EF-hand superfamily protein
MGSKRRPPSPAAGRSLSSDELADLDEQFDECDADGDQRIDFAEFGQLLENLGSELSPAQRRSRFDAIDVNHDGAIDRREFMDWWRGAA